MLLASSVAALAPAGAAPRPGAVDGSVLVPLLGARRPLLRLAWCHRAWRPRPRPKPPRSPVLAFEKAMEAAVVSGDTAFLERALAPTFVFTHGDGWVDGGAPLKVDSKASWIEYVKRQPPPYWYRELDHVQVELHGDIALTLGRY